MHCILTLVRECREFKIPPLPPTPHPLGWKRSDFKAISLMLLQVVQDTLELVRMSYNWQTSYYNLQTWNLLFLSVNQNASEKRQKRKKLRNISYNSLQSVFITCVLPMSFTELNIRELIYFKYH